MGSNANGDPARRAQALHCGRFETVAIAAAKVLRPVAASKACRSVGARTSGIP
jgi:hypothetical protein